MADTGTGRPVTVVRPSLRRAPFAEALADWLQMGVDAHAGLAPQRGPGGAAIVVVPEYLRAAPRAVLAALAAREWSSAPVALAAYGGRTRGRFAVADAREVLEAGGAVVVPRALGIDVAAVRASGFDEADVVLRDLVLDQVAEALARVRTG